jgi:predicted phage terminase large subunit-like protein
MGQDLAQATWADRVRTLDQQTLEDLYRLTTPRLPKPYVPEDPSPAQAVFLIAPQREVMYGGAAGGGKSIGLLMAALQYVDTPGYDAILFRRTFQDLNLPGALMDVAHSWLAPSDAKWDALAHRWTFPSGATLSFGYLATSNDRYRYQSAEFQFVGFDELTQFAEVDYTYLFSRLRRKEGVQVPLRMRAATNPGGIGHEWVRGRFVESTTEDTDRAFVPAKLDDNPFLDRDAYLQSLMELDPITRAQLLRGDWEARMVGPMFAGHWFQLVEQFPPVTQDPRIRPRVVESVRYWDLAATAVEVAKQDPDYTAGCLMGRTDDNLYVVGDIRRMRDTPKTIEALMRHTADLDPPGTVVWVEREPGSAGKAYIDHLRADVLPDVSIYEDKVSGDKAMRAAPLASHAEAGFVKMVRGPWNRAWLDELESFPIGAHDDQVDATSGAYRKLAQSQVTYSRSPF